MAGDELDAVRYAAWALQDAHDRRDEAVRAAADAGVPKAHIAAAAGLTRQAVYDIIRRGAGSPTAPASAADES